MKTLALLGSLLTVVAPARSSPPGELCIIERPVNYVVVTDPAKTVAAHCRRPTEAELAAVAANDGVLLQRGVYHLFVLPNEGPVRIEWTGQATGTQIYVSVWDGTAFDISDLRGQRDVAVTHARDVRRPASEKKIYVLVNSTNGSIRTDAFSARPLPRGDVAGAPTAAPAPEPTRAGADGGRVFWALCRGDSKIVLIASSTAAGVTAVGADDLEHLAGELGDATWYELPGASTERARVVPFGPPTLLEEDGGFTMLKIGGCSTPGAIFATAPVAEFPSSPVRSRQVVRAMRRTASAVAGPGVVGVVRAAGAPGGQTSVRLCRSESDGCFGWMFLDAKRRVRRLAEAGERTSWLSLLEPVGPREERQTSVDAARWLKPRGGSPSWIGVIRWEASTSECDGETCGSLTQEGVWLIWMRAGKLEVVKVVASEVAA